MLAVGALVAVAACGCGGGRGGARGPEAPSSAVAANAKKLPTDEDHPFGEQLTFHVDRAAVHKAGGDRLVAKLQSSAFGFFRLLARQFEARTCYAFRDLRWKLPVVAVQGDSHIEQFVVTRESYGLEDYDQAGYGPAIVDLVRYAASIDLACRQEKRWTCDAKLLIGRYFAAYREAIDHEIPRNRPPAVVARLRQKAPQQRAEWLAWVDKQIIPMSPTDDAMTRQSWAAFSELQHEVLPNRPASYYGIVKMGELRMGVGSMLEKKRLFRIRGPSDDPTDDIVLEARSGDTPSPAGCVWRPHYGTSMQVLMFMALLGPRVPEVLGYVTIDENPSARPFWVQSWDPGYVELGLADLQSQAEFEEVIVDGARQLGGHFWTRFPEPLRAYQRFAQLRAFDLAAPRAMELALALSREVVTEYEDFLKQH